MKEALIILVVVAVLLGLTALKYRRQITAVLRIYRQLKGIRSGSSSPQAVDPALGSETMVCCERCRKWVAEDRAIRFGRGPFFCSKECFEHSPTARDRV